MRRRARAGQTKRCSNAASRSDEGGDGGETSLLQAMSKAPQEHAQVMTAVWARCYGNCRWDSVGHLKPDAHRYARAKQGDLELFRCISGTETFFGGLER